MERQRQNYENRAANPHEAKKVNELEDDLRKAKADYHKRVRQLEEKYKSNSGIDKRNTTVEISKTKEDAKAKTMVGQNIIELETEEDALKMKE